ncbi:MAG: iron donor protein CyaY [Burkholderiales bacterium]|nr:iron donor protein CyaY [Burkholderiales bacterium]
MNESEFLNITDALFDQIEEALDTAGADVDVNRNGNVLELEFDSGAKLIVNRHIPNSEVWLAARSGGYHYRLAANGDWEDTRGGTHLLAMLAQLVESTDGTKVAF